MNRPLPRALIACMSEGREPRPHEVQAVAAQIWREAFCQDSLMNWASVPQGSSDYRKTIAVASAALGR